MRTLFFIFALLAIAPSICAQSALDGFDPNANGTIQIVVLQPDGKILIGGSFTSLAPNGVVPVTHKAEERQKVLDYCKALQKELRGQSFAGRPIRRSGRCPPSYGTICFSSSKKRSTMSCAMPTPVKCVQRRRCSATS